MPHSRHPLPDGVHHLWNQLQRQPGSNQQHRTEVRVQISWILFQWGSINTNTFVIFLHPVEGKVNLHTVKKDFFFLQKHNSTLPLLQVPAVQRVSSSIVGPTTPWGYTGVRSALTSIITQWSCMAPEQTTPVWQLQAACTVTSRRKHVGMSTQWWRHLWKSTGAKSPSASPGRTQVGTKFKERIYSDF